MKNKIILLSFVSALTLAFTPIQRKSEGSNSASSKVKATVKALYETDPVNETDEEDAADDPAIWYNKANPSQSRIIGTDKKGGLEVYNLQGKKLFFYADGNMNNVDIRYDFILGEDTLDIACASNRSTHSISIYSIQADGSLKNIASRTIVSEMQDEVYGFAMYKSPVTNKIYAFMNSKIGEVEQWELVPNENDTMIDAVKVREFKLGTQVEGMVADDENQVIFIGEEVNGIWKFGAEPEDSCSGEKLKMSSTETNENIAYDIEGLAIYYLNNGEGYLMASSQGNYTYAIFERKAPHNYLGSFRITDGKVDGAEETDGIEIFSFPLNKDFKHGLVVVQDGYNFDKQTAKPQNFKLVKWRKIARQFHPNLQIN